MSPAERLDRAAQLAGAWPEPYAAPLHDLLTAEAVHAMDVGDRYPDTALVLQIADGILAEDTS